MTAENEYTINFTEQHKKLLRDCNGTQIYNHLVRKQTFNHYLSLCYNGVSSYLFVNGVEIYKFKAKNPKINSYPMCLGNISQDFWNDNIEKI